ncbi:hypothetical protein [Paraglaciecola sp. MB-3u-78]|uniref:hypothetical protein n=1 Tax=Paraglaciecola sp. MB-3u-78 TaxID=2058332 RepID=UPI000C3478A5|nr:hypothetical protein [Paraglaciecola sp. MB-3u-78]PKH00548.1 hypothetical protein CXF95_03205 [Paraglaciecola sp. MB-3u-78]
MPIDLEYFLDIYAKALNTFDPKKVASFCLTPTIIMSDKSKKVITSELELEHAISQMFANFKQSGIKTFTPKLQQTMRLSDSLFFSKMRWQFFNEQDQLCFGCATSYTLQKMPDKQLKIIVAVIDDDENKLETISPLAE